MDEFHSFLFRAQRGRATVRGELVRLTDAWREMLRRRAEQGGYPPPVQRLLGEMAAAGLLLAGNIKFDGALVFQIMSDGPVRLAVVEVQADLRLRATAKLVGDVGPDDGFAELVADHPQGRCVITLDPRERGPGKQPYQGIVPLRGADGEPMTSVAEALSHYMQQSEQLDTRLVLAADDQTAAGVLIQRLPVDGGIGNDDPQASDPMEDFRRIAHLTATLTADELLRLDTPTLLRRLYWEETLHPMPLRRPRFECTCTRERVGRMLRTLGREEADAVLAEQGRIDVGCEFCGARQVFDAVDIGELFTPARDQPPASARVQ